MGAACCSQQPIFGEEISACNTMEEISQIIKMKKINALEEQKEINVYLKDKSKVPTMIDISEFEDSEVAKRVPYLDEMVECIEQIDNLINKHPNADINETKKKLTEFYNCYSWLYDDDKRYLNFLENFKNFMEESDKYEKFPKNNVNKEEEQKKELDNEI